MYLEFLNLFEDLAEVKYIYENFQLRELVSLLQQAAADQSRQLITRQLRIGIQWYYPN